MTIMAGLDGITVAAKKNRAGKSQLASELHRITCEKETEMRMHNNEKQRFKAKYTRPDLNQDNISNDAPHVRMYETHNPGFCYRRNGECRVPQVTSLITAVEFQDIHDLLFTNGEVDIEKVLCLHLLSTHRTESLTPPNKSHRSFSYLTREQSPLERLIERSKKRFADNSLSKLLPTYVLDVNVNNPEEYNNNQNKDDKSNNLISDGRLAARLLVNDKITQLIDTVLNALQNSNPEKMEELITLAGDPVALQNIIEKPEIQSFIQFLRGHTLLSSCESFHLTPPFRRKSIPLEIKTESGGLENLVKQIRKNVLQMPTQSTWKTMYQKSQLSTKESGNSSPESARSSVSEKDGSSKNSSQSGSSTSRFARQNFISKNKEAVINKKRTSSTTNESTDLLTPRTSRQASITSRRKEDIIAKTKENDEFYAEEHEEFLNFKTQEKALLEQEYGIDLAHEVEIDKTDDEKKAEEEELKEMERLRKNKMDYKTLAILLNNKMQAAYRRDIQKLREEPNVGGRKENAEEGDEVPSDKEVKEEKHQLPRRYSLKQTTCEACMQKWKMPLPSPKTPRIRKFSIPVLDQDTYNEVKTNSTHRISLLIDEELEKINWDDKFKKNNSGIRKTTLKKSPRNRSFIKNLSFENVTLNDLDLARIRQEIRVRETQKKLQNFLSNPV